MGKREEGYAPRQEEGCQEEGGRMSEQEARAVVVGAVTEGLCEKFPEADPERLGAAAAAVVHAIIDEYLRGLLRPATPEEGTVN